MIAIKPHPRNYEFLLRNLMENKISSVIPLNIAAWSEKCEMILHEHLSSTTASLMIKSRFKKRHFTVICKTLDDILNDLGLQRVDVIKINVEGSELHVLLGSSNIIERFKPKIIIEVWAPNLQKVLDFLSKEGYVHRVIRVFYDGRHLVEGQRIPIYHMVAEYLH